MHSERAWNKSNKGVFDFEKTYEKVGRQEFTQIGWLCKRYANTLTEVTINGGRNTYVTGFNDNNNYFSDTIGDRVRRCVLGGGYAFWSNCASRSMDAYASVLYANRINGGSAQVLFVSK